MCREQCFAMSISITRKGPGKISNLDCSLHDWLISPAALQPRKKHVEWGTKRERDDTRDEGRDHVNSSTRSFVNLPPFFCSGGTAFKPRRIGLKHITIAQTRI